MSQLVALSPDQELRVYQEQLRASTLCSYTMRIHSIGSLISFVIDPLTKGVGRWSEERSAWDPSETPVTSWSVGTYFARSTRRDEADGAFVDV